jgi:hypothetical protein
MKEVQMKWIATTWAFGVLAMQMPASADSVCEPSSAFPVGETVIDSTECAELDAFIFDAVSGDRFVVQMTECSDFGGATCGGAACAYDQCVELFDEAGTSLALGCTPLDFNNCSHRTVARIGPELIMNLGTHTIVARDVNAFGRGQFGVFIQRTNAPLGAEALSQGEERLESLDSCGDVDTYTITASAGESLQITMTPDAIGNVDPWLELYGPDGRAIDVPAGGVILRAMPVSGTYSLLARSRLNETGSYRISYTSL